MAFDEIRRNLPSLLGLHRVFIKQSCEVKVKFTLEEATNPQGGSRGIVLLFL